MDVHQPSLLDWSPPRSRTGYPGRPGSKRDGTSQEAADAIAPRAALLRDRVLAELRKGEGTADEISERMGINVLSGRPRFSELHLLGKIEETGERRRNASGKSAIVWRAA